MTTDLLTDTDLAEISRKWSDFSLPQTDESDSLKLRDAVADIGRLLADRREFTAQIEALLVRFAPPGPLEIKGGDLDNLLVDVIRRIPDWGFWRGGKRVGV